MPSSWVNVSPGKKMVWKVNLVSFSFPFSFSRPEIVITAQTQIATTSVSVNTTFFMFVLRLDLTLGYSLALAPILCVGDPSPVGFTLQSTNLLPHHSKIDPKDAPHDSNRPTSCRPVTR